MATTDLKTWNRALLDWCLSGARESMTHFGYGDLARAASEARARIPHMSDAEVNMALGQWPRIPPSEED